MCWTSDKIPVKKIASGDITCYKVFCTSNIIWNRNPIKFLGITVWNKYKIKELCSLYRDYLYVPYESNPEVNIFISKNKYHYLIPKSEYYYRWYIDEGYHSYGTLDKAKEERNLYEIIVKCIIPKGSAYYINDLGEIVSSSIIVTDKIVG